MTILLNLIVLTPYENATKSSDGSLNIGTLYSPALDKRLNIEEKLLLGLVETLLRDILPQGNGIKLNSKHITKYGEEISSVITMDFESEIKPHDALKQILSDAKILEESIYTRDEVYNVRLNSKQLIGLFEHVLFKYAGRYNISSQAVLKQKVHQSVLPTASAHIVDGERFRNLKKIKDDYVDRLFLSKNIRIHFLRRAAPSSSGLLATHQRGGSGGAAAAAAPDTASPRGLRM